MASPNRWYRQRHQRRRYLQGYHPCRRERNTPLITHNVRSSTGRYSSFPRPNAPSRNLPLPYLRHYHSHIVPLDPLLSIHHRHSLTPSYISQIQHLLGAHSEIVKATQTESYQYRDPVNNFLMERHLEFDWESAQRELKKAQFVLGEFKRVLWTTRGYLISEALYCRIHQRIDIE